MIKVYELPKKRIYAGRVTVRSTESLRMGDSSEGWQEKTTLGYEGSKCKSGTSGNYTDIFEQF
jgi:hypothetical protein